MGPRAPQVSYYMVFWYWLRLFGTNFNWWNTFRCFFYYKDNITFCSIVFTTYRCLSTLYFMRSDYSDYGAEKRYLLPEEEHAMTDTCLFIHIHMQSLIFGSNIQKQRQNYDLELEVRRGKNFVSFWYVVYVISLLLEMKTSSIFNIWYCIRHFVFLFIFFFLYFYSWPDIYLFSLPF